MVQKITILAIETSSRVGSLAIANGPQLLAETIFSAPMRHSAELFPSIQALLDSLGLRPDDIQQVYISVGPGSFTGLRIAVSMAKAMHLANSAKIVSVDTLDVIAANVINLNSIGDLPQANGPEMVAAILDAKRGQFYIGVYQKTSDELQPSSNRIWNKIIPDSIMTVDEFLQQFACRERPIWLLGDGLVYHKDKFKAEGICFFDEKLWRPCASKVHQLGWVKAQADEFTDPLTLIPNYLRVPNVTLKRK